MLGKCSLSDRAANCHGALGASGQAGILPGPQCSHLEDGSNESGARRGVTSYKLPSEKGLESKELRRVVCSPHPPLAH